MNILKWFLFKLLAYFYGLFVCKQGGVVNLGSSRIGKLNHPYFEDYNANEDMELQFYVDANNLARID